MTRGIEVPTAVEYEIFNKKGERLWMRLDNDYIYDTEGQVIAANVVAHDITERKIAEEELRKSETQLRATLEAIADGILAVDNKGKWYYQPTIRRSLENPPVSPGSRRRPGSVGLRTESVDGS